MLLLSPSFLVPCLTHDGVKVWDTLAIAGYLNELRPRGRPAADRSGRARALPLDLGEMHSGFSNLRAALPMNLKARYPGFKIWAGAQADIDASPRSGANASPTYNGPYLFGGTPAWPMRCSRRL